MPEVNYIAKIGDIYTPEVLVVGGGPAGIAAAISSARNGAETMLIEKYGFLGGMATNALVGPFMTCYDGKGETQIIKGVFDELVRRMEELGGAIHPSKVGWSTSYAAFIEKGHHHVTPFDSEVLKIAAEDMLQESGVKLLYYTQFIDCITEGNKIKSVIAGRKEGLCAINAKIIIDCSGDADVAEKAGVPTVKGRQKDNSMQPATMFFRVCNVDSDRVYEYVDENKHLMDKPFFGAFNWLIKEGRKTGEWDIKRDEMGTYETNQKGEWKLNTTRITEVDGTKSSELTLASIEGRKQARKVYSFLKKHVPGFENAKMMETGAAIGIRETRHIEGKYVIQKEDILNSRTFEDDILLCANAIDIHADDGSGGEYVVVDKWYGIPYRSLVPNNCDNLLVAGRSISSASEAVSAFRVMPPCFGIGQAAGTAAAICIKDAVSPEAVSVNKLQKTLISQGVFLDKQ
ncbi:FAD dependent oxidoreductase [Ruminiclostridium sufflavum DSM 19573]|uniref:FAD dependent oxidoreductase n=1 Tax=Ruminiclostridium sufflavum DSM 19573 TaxID=1121337 RepID=A0A318Y2Q3_9FIRM|nr:FAD-dependent oxidoreductase [Ruminiclostridium sufflavum]PYG85766.1 FAD dependent oxidoreductase [Ruminiclostridium sufflavum DSM 19573]